MFLGHLGSYGDLKVRLFYVQIFDYSSHGDSRFTLKKRQPVRQPVVQDDY